jgi:hypothetical protein
MRPANEHEVYGGVIDTISNSNQHLPSFVNVRCVAKVNVSNTNLIGLLSGFFK